MKYRTTSKAIKEGYWNIAQVGYCELQYLLDTYRTNRVREVAYTCGTYGWNYNVFEIDGNRGTLAICTGYRGMVGTQLDWNKTHDFNHRASLVQSWNYSGTDKATDLNNIIEEFYQYAMNKVEEEHAKKHKRTALA